MLAPRMRSLLRPHAWRVRARAVCTEKRRGWITSAAGRVSPSSARSLSMTDQPVTLRTARSHSSSVVRNVGSAVRARPRPIHWGPPPEKRKARAGSLPVVGRVRVSSRASRSFRRPSVSAGPSATATIRWRPEPCTTGSVAGPRVPVRSRSARSCTVARSRSSVSAATGRRRRRSGAVSVIGGAVAGAASMLAVLVMYSPSSCGHAVMRVW